MYKKALSHRLSCFVNSTLFGGSPFESICARLLRTSEYPYWTTRSRVSRFFGNLLVCLLDLIFSPVRRNHCKQSMLYGWLRPDQIDRPQGWYYTALARIGAAAYKRYLHADFNSRGERFYRLVCVVIDRVYGEKYFAMNYYIWPLAEGDDE